MQRHVADRASLTGLEVPHDARSTDYTAHTYTNSHNTADVRYLKPVYTYYVHQLQLRPLAFTKHYTTELLPVRRFHKHTQHSASETVVFSCGHSAAEMWKHISEFLAKSNTG